MAPVTVSGPGVDRAVGSAGIGLSVATTHANRASMRREEGSFYVRNEAGAVVGRADSDGAGGVQVYGPRILGASPADAGASGEGPAAPGRRGPSPKTASSAARRSSERSEPEHEQKEEIVAKTRSRRPRAVTPADEMQVAVERVSAKQAAVKVLSAAKEPLKTDELVRRVLKTKGVSLAGKTPEATIAAMLSVENKKPDGLFVRTDKGTYGLRERPKSRDRAAAA